MSKVKMIICIGSSCFARGNAENVKIVEDFMTLHGLSDELDIELSGGLCTNNCPDGPVVIVNDKIYKHVNRDVMQEIMESYFPVENGE
jgi:NADH:ubiquinone oxidoreductase subunit E